ncbi:MAG: NADP-specific glutamate dehydrogenase [Pseudomonadota bacterium]
MADNIDLDQFLERLRSRNPGEAEFHQAVAEVVHDILPVINASPRLQQASILDRLIEPERVIGFRIVWEDDKRNVRVNRGYRVQFNSAIGPYKGGLRFHPTVNPSILKFLAFEQTFKNALTGLPMGGGKGGSDFDPRECSDGEIMRFCNSFMLQLHRHIRSDTDVPAGDINVGEREIGYLFGAYRRITNEFQPVLTGKGLSFGGSQMRTEATGYGLLYFVREMLATQGKSIDGMRVVVSGAGNVATHAVEKAVDMGARVVTLSDSRGFILDEAGLNRDKLNWVRQHKEKPGTTLEPYTEEFGARWFAGKQPWHVDCDVALPCATQNELDEEAARALAANGCTVIAEGANMPVTHAARAFIDSAGLLYGPGKASNAGGVAVSGLEISQNRVRRSHTRHEVDEDLQSIMKSIHGACVEHGTGDDGRVNYARGANVAGFRKVAHAMLGQGYG